jgi:hypothetical protein
MLGNTVTRAVLVQVMFSTQEKSLDRDGSGCSHHATISSISVYVSALKDEIVLPNIAM